MVEEACMKLQELRDSREKAAAARKDLAVDLFKLMRMAGMLDPDDKFEDLDSDNILEILMDKIKAKDFKGIALAQHAHAVAANQAALRLKSTLHTTQADRDKEDVAAGEKLEDTISKLN